MHSSLTLRLPRLIAPFGVTTYEHEVLGLQVESQPVSAALENGRRSCLSECPTRVAVAAVKNEPAFEIPSNTWCIVVEDSAVQCKILQRYLRTKAGAQPERCLVLGETQGEIFGLVETASKLIREHTNDPALIVMDKNLDIIEGRMVSQTFSGSQSIQRLRQSLEPRDENRLLSLIRSANESVPSTSTDCIKNELTGTCPEDLLLKRGTATCCKRLNHGGRDGSPRPPSKHHSFSSRKPSQTVQPGQSPY